jgi:hypothetical protein
MESQKSLVELARNGIARLVQIGCQNSLVELVRTRLVQTGYQNSLVELVRNGIARLSHIG